MADDFESSADDGKRYFDTGSHLDQLSAKSFIENSPLGIHLYKLEEDDRLVFIGGNPAADRILGIENSQFIGKTIEEAFPLLIDTPIPDEYRRVAQTGKPFTKEQVDYKGEKIVGAFEVLAFQVAPNTVAATFRDITEQKQLVQEIDDKRREWESFFNMIAHPILILDKDHNILDANKQVCKLANVSKERLLGKKCYEWLKNSSQAQENCPLHNSIQNGSYATSEIQIEAFDSFFTVSCSPIYNSSGEIDKILHIATDVTASRKALQEVEDSKKHYYNIFESAEVGIIYSNLKGTVLDMNEKVSEIIGIPRDEVVGKNAAELAVKLVKVKDLPMLLKIVKNNLSGKITRKFDLPYNDKMLEISVSYNKKRKRVTGLIRDITEQSTIIEARKRSEEKYRALFTSANDSIFITNMKGQIVDVNPAACREYGYSCEEFLTMRASDMLHQDHVSMLEGFQNGLNDSGSIRGETVDLRKDGTSMNVEVSANIFKFNDEPHILVFVKDISELRKTMVDLNRAKHELETVISKTPLGIAIIEHGAKVRYVNPVFEEMFGYKLSEVSTSQIWFEKLYPDLDYRNNVQNQWVDIVSKPENISDESYEFEMTTKKGQKKLIRFKLAQFEQATVLLTMEDITKARKAELELREREAMLRTIFQAAPIGVGEVKNRLIGWTNEYLQKLVGYSHDELFGEDARVIYASEEEYAKIGDVMPLLNTMEMGSLESKFRHKNGKVVSVLVSAALKDPANPAEGIIFTVLDMSALRLAEEARTRMFNMSIDMMCVAGLDGYFKELNPAWERVLGWSNDELMAKPWIEFVHPDDRETTIDAGKNLGVGIQEINFENRYICKDGSFKWISWSTFPVVEEGIAFAIARDITAKKEMRRLEILQRDLAMNLGNADNLMEAFQACVEFGIVVSDMDSGAVYLLDEDGNARLEYTKGLSQAFEQAVAFYAADSINVQMIMQGKAMHANIVDFGEAVKDLSEFESLRAVSFVPVIDENDIIGVMNFASHHVDSIPESQQQALELLGSQVGGVLSRLRAEEALRESEENYRMILDNSLEGIFLLQNDHIVFCNLQFALMWGYSDETAITGVPYKSLVASEDIPLVEKSVKRLLEGELPVTHVTFNAVRGNGSEFEVEALASSVTFKGLPAVQGAIRDVSEQRKLEAQLTQAQKMESIGRLAGGVAHDFNNLLTAISGTAEMMQLEMSENDPFFDDTEQILKTSARAAELTRQLLAFSRKQVIKPRVLDLNHSIEVLDRMLRRLIGEDIRLVLDLQEALWPIKADPVQIEQILVNLAVNSRDAMPKGGLLSIKTENRIVDDDQARTIFEGEPGHYICLAVSDTGEGIAPEVLEHIFEPFFTTKPKEHGTGLGLSTVYGVVKQNKGMITCYSEIGNGTTFRVYLPREASEEVEDIEEESITAKLEGNENILVVEDEDVVRDLAERTLRQYGYQVLTAATGGDALLLVQRFESPVDLVLTDVIMPNLSGPELIDIIREHRPDMKVLFMSGYTEDVLAHRGILDEQVDYISKPFRPKALLERIRTILDRE